MQADEYSKLEKNKLSLQEALPYMSFLICSLRARSQLNEAHFTKVTLKYERVRWELATFGLRLTREGINRYIIEELNGFSDLTEGKLKKGLNSYLHYAIPSLDPVSADDLISNISDKVMNVDPTSNFSDVIFESMLETSWEAFQVTIMGILSPKTLLRPSIMNVETIIEKNTRLTGKELEIDEYFNERLADGEKWRVLNSFFGKYEFDKKKAASSKKEVNVKPNANKSNEELLSLREREKADEENKRIEQKRLEKVQINANKIIQASQTRLELKLARRNAEESSAFPNSKIIPVTAMRNILRTSESTNEGQSKFISALSKRIALTGDQMDFFEFSKAAALTEIELKNVKGQNKRLNRLKSRIEVSGKKNRTRSESPKRGNHKDNAESKDKERTKNKFKPQVELPEQMADPIGYKRACACCALF